MKIKWFQDPIDPQHLNCLWYGGRLFEIKHKGYTFIVGAFGEVRATLLDLKTGEVIAESCDKQQLGRFYEEMSPYIRNDQELIDMLTASSPDGELTLEWNNWLEVLIDDPKGETHDFGWVLDTENVWEAVTEVMINMDDVIKEVEE